MTRAHDPGAAQRSPSPSPQPVPAPPLVAGSNAAIARTLADRQPPAFRTAAPALLARTTIAPESYPAQDVPVSRIHDLLSHFKSMGLPVGALDSVVDSLKFEAPEGRTQPYFTPGVFHPTINVGEGSLKAMEGDHFSGPMVEGSNPELMFHELTHAYIHFHQKDADLAPILAEAKTAYTGSKMEDGSTSTDPERVMQEAAAEYVGGKISAYYQAITRLTRAANDKKLTQATIDSAAKDYDREMAKRVRGYEVRWMVNEVLSATRIPEKLRQYLDSKILANKFAEKFAAEPTLNSFRPSKPTVSQTAVQSASQAAAAGAAAGALGPG